MGEKKNLGISLSFKTTEKDSDVTGLEAGVRLFRTLPYSIINMTSLGAL